MTTAAVSLETLSYTYNPTCGDHIVGVLRIHPEGGNYREGSPYSWSATAEIINNKAYLYGAMKSVTPSEWRLIHNYFKSIGCTSVGWSRKNNLEREVNIDL